MIITLFACDMGDVDIEATVSGDVIKINGEDFDFSELPDDYRLPGYAVDSIFFDGASYITRVDGEISLTLRFPVYLDTPDEYRNPPENLVLKVADGKVEFPDVRPKTNDEVQPVLELED